MTKQNPHTQNAAVDMNPMLDIVFILLIFFIVTTSFNRKRTVNSHSMGCKISVS